MGKPSGFMDLCCRLPGDAAFHAQAPVEPGFFEGINKESAVIIRQDCNKTCIIFTAFGFCGFHKGNVPRIVSDNPFPRDSGTAYTVHNRSGERFPMIVFIYYGDYAWSI